MTLVQRRCFLVTVTTARTCQSWPLRVWQGCSKSIVRMYRARFCLEKRFGPPEITSPPNLKVALSPESAPDLRHQNKVCIGAAAPNLVFVSCARLGCGILSNDPSSPTRLEWPTSIPIAASLTSRSACNSRGSGAPFPAAVCCSSHHVAHSTRGPKQYVPQLQGKPSSSPPLQ